MRPYCGRFAPELRYDNDEAFFADSAQEWVDNPGNELRRTPRMTNLLATTGGTPPVTSNTCSGPIMRMGPKPARMT